MEILKKGKSFVSVIARCESLLRRYSASHSLSETKKLHAFILTFGLLSSSHLSSTLATTYAQCNHASYASHLFDNLPHQSLFSWNTMMRMYVQIGQACDALNLFVEMLGLGHTMPDNFTYPIVIKACGDLSLIDMGVGVHGQTFKAGFDMDTFVQNSLLAMYMNAGEKEAAQLVFDMMEERTVVSWNTMINGYFRNICAEEALRVYNRMVDVGVEPDCTSVVSVLPACGLLKNVELGREIHALVREKQFWGNMVVMNALLDMYVKCGHMKEAWLLVNEMNEKDVVTWTTLINGYILDDDARSALMLCPMMQHGGVKPNSVTIASLLSACGSLVCLYHGKCLHGWAIRHRLDSEVHVETALIDMYVKCNHGNLSHKVFMKTSKRRTAPWNAVLSGFIHNRLAREAIEFFKQMLVEDIEPDIVTFNSLLPAYAILADLQQAMNIHCYLIRVGFLSRLEVASILVDIYSKCGSLQYAHEIFNVIPLKDKDIIIWSAIIAAYGKHGHGDMAVFLFNQMVHSGVKPNQVTFTSVLHACSHTGLVDEGLSLFKFMLKQHQVIPHVDHYTCIIDLLGRAGRLNDAYNLIRTMPIKPNHAVWGALLGACVIHENVELGEEAARWTFELEPENTGNYVLLAKLYAAVGRWRDAEKDLKKLQGQMIAEQEALYGSKPSPSKPQSVKKAPRMSTGGAASRRVSLGGVSLGGAMIQTPKPDSKANTRAMRKTDKAHQIEQNYLDDGLSCLSSARRGLDIAGVPVKKYSFGAGSTRASEPPLIRQPFSPVSSNVSSKVNMAFAKDELQSEKLQKTIPLNNMPFSTPSKTAIVGDEENRTPKAMLIPFPATPSTVSVPMNMVMTPAPSSVVPFGGDLVQEIEYSFEERRLAYVLSS